MARTRSSTTGCTSAGTPSFVGVAAGNDAGGKYSGVLAGKTNEACAQADAIGGGSGNLISTSAPFSFIGAGTSNVVSTEESAIGAGIDNLVSGGAAFIGAGDNNTASGTESFVGAGYGNVASGQYAVVGAGSYNVASATGSIVGAGDGNAATSNDSMVGAGVENSVTGNGSFIGAGGYDYSTTAASGSSPIANSVSGADSFLGAGDLNTIAGTQAFIGAGENNTISSAGLYGVIAGGNANTVSSSYAAVGGGSGNKAEAPFAVVPGGADNEALGAASFAAGYHAEAAHTGSFVWSDDVSGSLLASDGAANEFVVRASGGTTIYSSENLKSGVTLAAGSGTWSSLSDRNAKTGIAPLDDASILAKVVALPVSSWQYKTEPGVRHAGPMAQDFYAAFRLGEDDRHITSIDEDGVALSAIKALARKRNALATRLSTLEHSDESSERRLRSNERRNDDDIAAMRAELRRLQALVVSRARR